MTELNEQCEVALGEHIGRETLEDRSPSSTRVSDRSGKRDRDSNSSTGRHQLSSYNGDMPFGMHQKHRRDPFRGADPGREGYGKHGISTIRFG